MSEPTYRVGEKSKPLPNYKKIVLDRIKAYQGYEIFVDQALSHYNIIRWY